MNVQLIEKTKHIIAQARNMLENGDYDSIYMANYLLRDIEVVRTDSGLSDLAWTGHKCGNLSKNDVLFLIELIEKKIG